MNKCSTCDYLMGDCYCHRYPPVGWQDQACPQKASFTRVNPVTDGCGEWKSKNRLETKIVEAYNRPIVEEEKKRGRPKGS